eukprot:TRINITY_DN21481_c0_g1_i1.p1 TRINITY_DN21481_c0_g1~~TRINITY_DN21481_c0_g1_i1.p1  ORF type:complete len:466 (+),score=186.28 TRINITY_DN21481_c0_g1_i1:70-1398(+)
MDYGFTPPSYAPYVPAEMEDAGDDQPRILLMGLRKSGKTSIQKVVFEKVAPHDTMMLETSAKVNVHGVSNVNFVRFQILDFPGQLMELAHGDEVDTNVSSALSGPGAVVFVVDCNDAWPPSDAVRNLVQTMLKVVSAAAASHRPTRFEVFMHKVDCLQQEQLGDRLITLKLAIEEELNFGISERVDKGDDVSGRLAELQGSVRRFLQSNVYYHLTSIYDRSVFDAFSKVVQRVMGSLHHCITTLLDMLVQNTAGKSGDGAKGIEKAYLFDVVSKIYIAQDTHEGTSREQVYKTCFDMLDVAIDLSVIYGPSRGAAGGAGRARVREEEDDVSLEDDDTGDNEFGGSSSAAPAQAPTAAPACDENTAATVRLDNGQVLYLREVDRQLALVCVVQEEGFRKRGLLNYNVMQFRKLLKELFRCYEQGAQRRAQLARQRLGDGPAAQ